MNKQVHRLVFDRRRGMRVPAAEHVRSAGKAAGGERRATARAASSLLALAAVMGPLALGLAGGDASAQQRTMSGSVMRSAGALANMGANVNRNLPQAYSGTVYKDQGKFTTTYGSNWLNVNQQDDKVIINWDSFNLGRGYKIRYIQPSSTSSAMNYIWSLDPAVIQGSIEANGEVILQSQNGLIFSPTARVDTQRFVATALKLAKDTYLRGIRAGAEGATFGDDESLPTGFITVERGAEIKALAGGDVIMVAPKVYNEGTIETPKGQTILAAGQKVYLYAPTDASQRGLVVAVDAFADSSNDVNTVEQAAKGSYQSEVKSADGTVALVDKINQISAEQGSINLVGMTIRQNGVLTATTAVKGQNGAIYLQAQKNTAVINGKHVAAELGTVDFGVGSQTSVTPSTVLGADGKALTQKDAEVFYRSSIDVIGQDIRVRDEAVLEAVSGNVSLRAATNAQASSIFDVNQASGVNDGSHLVVDAGAKITAAGLRDVAVPMSRNQVSGRLFQTELADSPVQRGGVLYRSEFLSDARRLVGVANVAGQYNLIERTAQELSTRGGHVRLLSQGDLFIADDASIDISGGSLRYDAGQITSSLLRRGTQLIPIEYAQAGVHYDALITPDVRAVTQQVPSYVQGADGGVAIVGGTNSYLGSNVLKADVVLGPNQRSGALAGAHVTAVEGKDLVVSATNLPAELGVASLLKTQPSLYASMRPMGGTLVVGHESGKVGRAATQLTAQIELDGAQGTALGAAPELGTSAAQDFFAALGTTMHLSASDLQASGVSGLTLQAQNVSLSSSVKLDLGASGQLSVDANRIQIAGAVRAAGGTVALSTYDLVDQDGHALSQGLAELRAGASVDVSGTRLDERASTSAAAVKVDGGRFSVDSSGSATVAQGSVVDVSAGVWRSVGGSTSTGSAGSVSLVVNADRSAQVEPSGLLTLGGRLSAFDFKSGGQLSLGGMTSLTLGTATTDALGMALDEAFLSDHGFGTFNLSALGDVTVVGRLAPVLRNLVLTTSRQGLASDSLTTLEVVDASNRQGIKLNLEASLKPGDLQVEGHALSQGGSVRVLEGAVVDVGAAGQIGLKAGRGIDVAGTLVAHGGAIALSLNGDRGGASDVDTKDAAGFVDGQEIRLRAGSVLDVSGVALTSATSTGAGDLVRGKVLAGGTVSLNAKADKPSRGRVVTESGSLIDVSGMAADIDLNRSAGGKVHLSQGAGSVSVASADGFTLMGTLKADRPDASVSGGQFSASISREGLLDFTSSTQKYPAGPRQLTLLNSAAEVAAHTQTYGEGVLSSTQLLSAGFDQIQLRADDRILLGQGVNLVALANAAVPLRSVQLTAPVLLARDSGTHTVQATYVSLGDRDLKPQTGLAQPVLPTAIVGDAGLSVQAGLIEVYGNSALQGFGNKAVVLDATLDKLYQIDQRRDGEIRFIGRSLAGYNAVANADLSDLVGHFHFGGDLTLKAGQVYASTLSDFTVQGLLKNSNLTVVAPQAGSTSATPLSALAQLSLNATNVTVGGVIRQPFGSITINAEEQATLLDGSVLSVTGDGVTVPVGSTINARQWVYATNGTVNGVDPTIDYSVKSLDGLPVAKGVLIKGEGLSIGDLAQVKAQAGGDLQAWEFIAGVGGSTDTLNRPNVFAILPGYHHDFAPFDTEIAASTKAVGTTLTAGDQVQITTGSGVLAAGLYTLLPARYATLPGAVLVSTSTLNLSKALPQAIGRDDGSVVVSGYKTAVGTELNGGQDPRQVLVLEPQATFRAKSALEISSINTYLSDRAERHGTALPSLAGDAGRLSLVADQPFQWAGDFNLAGAAGFEAGQLDLAMPDLTVVGKAASAAGGEAGLVSVDALNTTQAGSILLGGVRTGTVEDTHITTLANTVTLHGEISTGELMAVARNEVYVAQGTHVVASTDQGDAEHVITIDGAGAALVVGRHANTDLRRDLSGVTERSGTLVVDTGVTLQGASVQLDGTQLLKLDSDLALNTTAIGVGAPRIALGGVSTGANALSISGELLSTYGQASRLQLRSYSSIDLLGSVKLGERGTTGAPTLQSLTLDAPELRGIGTAGDTARLLAQNVVLRNTSRLAPASTQASTTRLEITAEPGVKDGHTGGITVGAGTQNLAFATSRLDSRGDVTFSGVGQLNARGDITVASARVTADSSARHGINSQGVLTLEQAAQGRTLGEQVGAGGSLALTGQRVVQDGTIDLPSGTLALTGRGQDGQADTVVFTERSSTKAAGWVTKAGDSWSASAPGGQIKAQALKGDVVVKGLLDVSAPTPTSTSDAAKTAGTITLTATEGALRVGAAAVLKGSAATDTLSGSLVVDARNLVNEPASGSTAAVASAEASRGTLDRLINAANAGGLHGEVDVRVREGHQSLDTTLKAVRASLSADTGRLNLLSHAVIDATAPQGGVVQLAAGQDLTIGAGAQIRADASRVGANGGDVWLTSTAGLVHLEKTALISAAGDDALDGRVVIQADREALLKMAANTTATADTGTATIKAGEVDVVGNRVYQADTVAEGSSGSLHTETETSRSTKVVTAVTRTTTKVTTTDTTIVTTISYQTDPVTGEVTQTVGEPVLSTNTTVVSTATPTGAKTGTTTVVQDKGTVKQVSPEMQYAGLTDIAQHADSFVGQEASVLAAMGLTGQARLRAGVELRSAGDFTLNSDLSLADALHPGGQALFLTIRAQKDLTFKGSLSDGFSSADRFASVNAGEGASYRLVAGADTTAAQVLKTRAADGSITIDAGKLVRTTSGSIEMAAAQDIVLKTDYATNSTTPVQGVAYVAGRLSDLPEGTAYSRGDAEFTSHGGRFEASAGRDIVAPGASQLFGSWFNHVGYSSVDQDTGATFSLPVAWWSTFSAFKQGFGSFGGGNIRAVAGGNISNLGVVAPSALGVLTTTVNNLETGEVLSQSSESVLQNGGDVTVKAGGDVRGGSFFVGRGDALVQAGGAIAIGDSLDASRLQAMGVVIGQMDGHVALQARDDINLALSFNPTMYVSNKRSKDEAGLYLSYGQDSSLASSSVAGNVNWLGNSRSAKVGSASFYLAEMAKLGDDDERILLTPSGGINPTNFVNFSMGLVAPVLQVAALQGDVVFDLPPDALTMAPSAQGNLGLYAGRDLRLTATGSASLNLADGKTLNSYSLAHPRMERGVGATTELKALNAALIVGTAGASELHKDDDTPVRIHAERDLVVDSGTVPGLIKLTVSKPAEITAGRDISNLSFTGQHFDDTDVTLIKAGGSITGARNPPGTTTRTGGLIKLNGPGELQVEAGRQLDLSTSAGIETVGRIFNTALPELGARIRLSAGMDKSVDVDEFVALYVAQDPTAQASLVSHVKQTLALDDTALPVYAEGDPRQAQALAQALSYYRAMTPAHQRVLAEQVINAAFVKQFVQGTGLYAGSWADKAARFGVSVTDYQSAAFQQFKGEVLMAEVKRLGKQATDIADSTDAAESARRKAQRDALWAQLAEAVDLSGYGRGFDFHGDIDLAGSKVQTRAPGDLQNGGIDLFAPGGQVIVGLSTLTATDKLQADTRGLISRKGGSIRSFSSGDFQVNSQKAFVVGTGDLLVYSSHGSIDSGRGSNTDVTAPAAVAVPDPNTGIVSFEVPVSTTGSGIGILRTADGLAKGDVLLGAPGGEVRALDAYIRNEGGNIGVGAQRVVGSDNLKGTVSGLAAAPVVSVSLNVNSTLPTDAAAGALAAVDTVQGKKAKDPASILTVDLLGLGSDETEPAVPAALPGAPSSPKHCPKEGCQR